MRQISKGFGLMALGLLLAVTQPAVAALTLQLNMDGHTNAPSFEIDGSVIYDPVTRTLSLNILQLRSSALHNPLFCHDFDSGNGVLVNVGASDAGAQRLLRDLVHSAGITYQPTDKTLTLRPRPSVQCFYTKTPGDLDDFGLFGIAPSLAGGMLPVQGLIFRDSFAGEVILTALYDNVVATDGRLEYRITISNTGSVVADQLFIQELIATAQSASIEGCTLVDLRGSQSRACPSQLSDIDGQLALVLPFGLEANTALVLDLVRTGSSFAGASESNAQLLGVINGRGRAASFATAVLTGQAALPPTQ